MITKTGASVQRSSATRNWQTALAEAIREPQHLLQALQLPNSLLDAAQQAARQFPLRVPHSYLSRMRHADLNDPLLRQVLPLAEETRQPDWGGLDPVGDQQAMKSPGLLHKYQGRALLVSTAACAVHCRYCFRRHFPYTEANPLGSQWPATLSYLKQHADIHEVILSGGDPLSLSDARLAAAIEQLAAIPHLHTLRIHSRLPVVIPQRLTHELLQALTATRLQAVLVLHFNHANELDQSIRDALAPLRYAGVTLLNQAVLLRGVNDSLPALSALSRALFQVGILPYYLHQLDKVQGAAHFEVDLDRALMLMRELQGALPGYLVPRFVQEQAGEPSKTLLGPW